MNTGPFLIEHSDGGCEIYSNDRRMKYILRKEMSFYGPEEQTTFAAYCFIKEGCGWEQGDNTTTYPTREAFYRAIEKNNEFSKAFQNFTYSAQRE